MGAEQERGGSNQGQCEEVRGQSGVASTSVGAVALPTWQVLDGDVRDRLKDLDDASIQCVVTSPPYWGLRDYGVNGQIGLEDSIDDFIAELVDVFREVRRVLRADGVCWVNMGDSYAMRAQGASQTYGSYDGHLSRAERPAPRSRLGGGLKNKDLIGQPWMVAFALRADGWYLRSEVIWHKPCPMPESATDRPARAHEQVFLFSKSPRYFYDEDAIRTPLTAKTLTTFGTTRNAVEDLTGLVKQSKYAKDVPERQPAVDVNGEHLGAKKRTVWTIAPEPFPEAHFATYPPALVEPCVLAGTSPTACGTCGAPYRRLVSIEGESTSAEGRPLLASATAMPGASPDLRKHGGHHGDNLKPRQTTGWEATCEHDDPTGRCKVLDPFAGAGTTLMVALRNGRSAVGVELNAEYSDLARRRIRDDAPLLNTMTEVTDAAVAA